ncbi:MAG: hypothetical protein FJX80_06285 [Bacteroidetes bacterium]|nr:hypothetical protein [Bacteroidota bacterium]
MNNLDFIAKLCKDHLYNPNCEHFGGANLIITDHGPDTNEFDDTIVVHPDASILSWLVFCLKALYNKQLDHINKYEFYPSLGIFMIEAKGHCTTTQEIIEHVLFRVEQTYGQP